jgi:hypothetical protein
MNVAKAYLEILQERVESFFVVVSCGLMDRDASSKREISHIRNMLVNGSIAQNQ